jgi:uncharacterized repeat protein (TIGR01451 family)
LKHKALIGLSTLVIAGLPAVALAWHPKGTIKKEVMNVTQGIAYSDANTSATAVQARPGDTLKYRVTVSNIAEPASNEWNNLYYVALTDKMPAGITSTTGNISMTLGMILPKQSATREFEVKVAQNADGSIKNTACFTGNSKVNDNPQQGCDDAYVNVTRPVATPSPTPSPTPTHTPSPTPTPTPSSTPAVLGAGEAPAELPATGAEAALGSLAGIGGIAYATRAYLRSRRGLKSALKNVR